MAFRRQLRFLALFLGACSQEVSLSADLSWSSPPAPTYTEQPRLGITNNGEDTLAFVTADTAAAPRLLGKATVGSNPIELEGPHHLASSLDGRFIFLNLSNYVVNGGSGPHGAHGTGTVSGYLLKLDVRQNRPVAKVLVDRSPGDVILSADGKTVYVSHYDLARLNDQLIRQAPPEEGFSKIAIIAADSLELLSMIAVCPTAHGQGLSQDGKRLFVTCTLSDELAVLDVANPSQPALVAKVAVGANPGQLGHPSYAPYALSVHPNGTVWISNNGSKDVRVFDPQALAMDFSKVIPVGGIAMFGDFVSTDQTTLYIPHQGDDRITAIDTKTLQTQELSLPAEACLNAHVLRILPNMSSAVLICEGDHRVRKGTAVFIDLAQFPTPKAVRGFVETGLFSDGVTYLPAL